MEVVRSQNLNIACVFPDYLTTPQLPTDQSKESSKDLTGYRSTYPDPGEAALSSRAFSDGYVTVATASIGPLNISGLQILLIRIGKFLSLFWNTLTY